MVSQWFRKSSYIAIKWCFYLIRIGAADAELEIVLSQIKLWKISIKLEILLLKQNLYHSVMTIIIRNNNTTSTTTRTFAFMQKGTTDQDSN